MGAGAALAACGDEEDQARFANKKIIDRLELEEADSSFAIGGDPFCIVEGELLNDADEVESARGETFVIASANGNVGVHPVAPFAPDCRARAKKELNRLDPKPKD